MQNSKLTPDDPCPYLLTLSPLVWVESENTMAITPIIMLFYVRCQNCGNVLQMHLVPLIIDFELKGK